VVLGLDPDPARVDGGAGGARDFCLRVIEQAAPHCVAAKPQLACFERFGAEGWQAFEDVAQAASDAGLLVIADAKRGDVDATARHYAAAFLRDPVDALTVNPMLGTDAVQPFLDACAEGGQGLFVLVRTSNPGAAELEDLQMADGRPWHEAVADRVRGWGEDLPAGLDLVAFDAAVNSGPARGAKWLQMALGVAADGKVGPMTVAAAQRVDVPLAIRRALQTRLSFLMGLKHWGTFGKGWSRRVASVEAVALAMAGSRVEAPPRPDMAQDVVANETSKTNTKPGSVSQSGDKPAGGLAYIVGAVVALVVAFAAGAVDWIRGLFGG
jgi:orotidine-5'-phosphate decarboxylase